MAVPGVVSAAYGVTAKGEAVQVFTLINSKRMSVKVLDYGGAIFKVMAPDRAGKLANVVFAVSVLKTLDANGSLNTLDVRTTELGLQIYSGNHQNNSLLSAAVTMVRQTDAIALETQHFPNSPNQSRFPSTVLRPGQVLRSTTPFRFGTDRNGRR